MKCAPCSIFCRVAPCRTPQGVRGLKLWGRRSGCWISRSHPARGAWIEMLTVDDLAPMLVTVAPRKGCVD